MLNQFSRTALIIGDEALEQLHQKRVAIFGIGGVGGYVAEGLARAGIGAFDLFDDDIDKDVPKEQQSLFGRIKAFFGATF